MERRADKIKNAKKCLEAESRWTRGNAALWVAGWSLERWGGVHGPPAIRASRGHYRASDRAVPAVSGRPTVPTADWGPLDRQTTTEHQGAKRRKGGC